MFKDSAEDYNSRHFVQPVCSLVPTVSMSKSQAALAACMCLSLISEAICQVARSTEKRDGYTKFPKIFGNSATRRLIEGNGMKYENHSVITEDGWILNLNRIVNPDRKGVDRGYPLFLLNGYFMQSEAWLVQSKIDSNIAIQWAKQGYDVWLGDQRGTMRSRKHLNLTEKDAKYWDFTFHEIGLYDTPAFIDYILQKTGRKDLIYSCMSLGCAFHGVMATLRPEYNEKIRAAIYFVPLVNNIRKIQDMGAIILSWFKSLFILVDAYEGFGQQDILPQFGLVKKEMYRVCKSAERVIQLSSHILYGPYIHFPRKGLCEVALLSAGGANVKSTQHVLQVYETGDFAQFDYGREENRKRYGTDLPPMYDMSKITSFLAIYYSDKDMFATVEGVQKTLRSVGGPTYSCMMPNFNHLDVAAGTTFHYVLPDVNDLLGALTGYKNNTEKLRSGKCPSLEWMRHRRN